MSSHRIHRDPRADIERVIDRLLGIKKGQK